MTHLRSGQWRGGAAEDGSLLGRGQVEEGGGIIKKWRKPAKGQPDCLPDQGRQVKEEEENEEEHSTATSDIRFVPLPATDSNAPLRLAGLW